MTGYTIYLVLVSFPKIMYRSDPDKSSSTTDTGFETRQEIFCTEKAKTTDPDPEAKMVWLYGNLQSSISGIDKVCVRSEICALRNLCVHVI